MVRLIQHLSFLFMCIGFSYAGIETSVSQTEIYDDESFLLTVSISPAGSITNNDLAALQSLFNIESRNQSTETQIINGKRSSTTRYQFRLSPKSTGTLGIPNFHANGEQSQPLFIRVLDSQQRQDDLPDDAVLFTASFDKQSAYIDETVTLNVQLAMKISVDQASFDNLDQLGVELTQVDSRQGQQQINGSLYNVYDFSYQFSQAEAGLLSLPDIRFSAFYPNRVKGRMEKFSRKASTGALEIKPVPEEYPSNAFWLPLNNLSLIDNLPEQLLLEQNQHQTWNLQLIADGAPGNELPDLLKIIETQLDDNIRLYKNPAQVEGNQRSESAAMSFIDAGEFTLPAVRVPWWNLQTDQLEWAELPARSVSVTPAAFTNGFAPLTDTSASPPIVETEIVYQSNPLWLGLAIFSSLGWLATVIVTWLMRHQQPEQKQVSSLETDINLPEAGSFSQCYQQYLQLKQQITLANRLPAEFLTAQELQKMQDLEAFLYQGAGSEPEIKEVNKILQRLAKQLPKVGKGRETANHFSLLPE